MITLSAPVSPNIFFYLNVHIFTVIHYEFVILIGSLAVVITARFFFIVYNNVIIILFHWLLSLLLAYITTLEQYTNMSQPNQGKVHVITHHQT